MQIRHWIDEWPTEYRAVVQAYAARQGFDEIHKVRELSGGSGARTFLAAPEAHNIGRPKLRVLKVGHEVFLGKEMEGHKLARNYYKGGNQVLGRPIKKAGSVCIPMELAGGYDGNIKTFAEFYMENADPNRISDVVEQLFTETLGYPNINIKRQNANPFKLYQIDDPELVSRGLREVQDNIPTCLYWWQQAAKTVNLNSLKCLTHGDLHSGNVIVNENAKPFVIDFGRTDFKHAFFDFAKFEREIRLFLFLRDSTNPQRDFDRLEKELMKKRKYAGRDLELAKARKTIDCLRQQACRLLNSENWELEYKIALFAQFMFAACNSRIRLLANTRKRATVAENNDFCRLLRMTALKYCNQLKDEIEKNVTPLIPSSDIILQRREEALWRLAYAFLRLDQLPSGGWAKTLTQWMDTVWEGDQGTVLRSHTMRTSGGVDLTCYALDTYLYFLKSHIPRKLVPHFVREHQVVEKAKQVLAHSIGHRGGIGVGLPVTGGRPLPIKLRHTIFAVIAFLRYGEANDYTLKANEELRQTVQYVDENLDQWQLDDSHLFAMLGGAVKLYELVNEDVGRIHLHNTSQRKQLSRKLARAARAMSVMLENMNHFDPKPPDTCRRALEDFLFPPYCNFWRMQRSNFVMYLPYYITEEGTRFNKLLGKSFKARLRLCFEHLLRDVAIPFDPKNPKTSLMCYHHDDGLGTHRSKGVPRDWGLTAEFAALLKLQAVRNLLEQSVPEFDEKWNALCCALKHTFDLYHEDPQIFRFTHGVSFGRYLALVDSVNNDDLQKIDGEICKIRFEGVTEYNLNEFVKKRIVKLNGRLEKSVEICSRAIKDLLVAKLESGEYKPSEYETQGEEERRDIESQDWKKKIKRALNTTIAFYEEESDKYVERYSPEPEETLILQLDALGDWSKVEGKRRALDVGCGPGQYAEMLKRKGFKVDLVDTSPRMLLMASKRIGLRKVPEPIDIYDLAKKYHKQEFDLIFSCAMMIHVPRDRVLGVYEDFYRMLKPGGVLFVNFKIRDHTLISMDKRFFEYYRDDKVPEAMLSDAGFVPEVVIMTKNTKNSYGDPKEICWTNFYCKKPIDR